MMKTMKMYSLYIEWTIKQLDTFAIFLFLHCFHFFSACFPLAWLSFLPLCFGAQSVVFLFVCLFLPLVDFTSSVFFSVERNLLKCQSLRLFLSLCKPVVSVAHSSAKSLRSNHEKSWTGMALKRAHTREKRKSALGRKPQLHKGVTTNSFCFTNRAKQKQKNSRVFFSLMGNQGR